jgi:hypothetical protein
VSKKADKLEEIAASGEIVNFVQDQFFEKGHWLLKTRQILMNLLFLLVLLVPILILINSLTSGKLWKELHFWSYQDGFELSSYLQSSILYGAVAILVGSLAFLYRNNHREQKVYPKKRTYDSKKLASRKKILNKMYTERFGNKKLRETAKYYVVEGEQNLPDHMISNLFKEGGVEIK